MMKTVKFESLTKPQRLDVYLSSIEPALSRSYIKKQIINGRVSVNKKNVKANHLLKNGDKISFDLSTSIHRSQPEVQIPIIYEDKDCIILNKPSGVLTHAKGPVNEELSVASFIRKMIDPKLNTNRAGIVHRLDRDTSGIIVTAKNAKTMTYFQNQFAKRLVIKQYLAIINGNLEPSDAIICMPIKRNPKKPALFMSALSGKPAETTYKVLTSNDGYSLLLLTPTTGRTHQLRVHLKSIHHPIVGDRFYGGENAARLMLHAYSLSLILPDKGRVTFKAPLDSLAFSRYINLTKLNLCLTTN